MGSEPIKNIDEYGTIRWFVGSHLHRTDGPAVEWANGSKEWWLNGKLYSFEDYLVKLENLGYEDQATNLLFKLDEV